MAVVSIALAVATLVPAPYRYEPREGTYRVTVVRPCSQRAWWDYDLVADCLEKASVSVSTDVSLPAEGYRLVVRPDGIDVTAADGAGAFYARQTLRQLGEAVATNAIALPCCEICDWPRYRWRGVLIDEARNFLGKAVVKRVIDLMSQHKMNVLHWHLTDDQGWRLELGRHPELTTIGAKRSAYVRYGTHARWPDVDRPPVYELDGESPEPRCYRAEDIREIREYAKRHFVTIVPEIELPGHCRALLAAHPELSCTGRIPPEPVCHPCISEDVICVGNDAAVRLYEEILDEVCDLFPDSPAIHIGGDECPRVRWKECPKCQERLRRMDLKNEEGLQSWFCSHMVRYLERKGRRAVGWDEMLAGDVPKSAIGMTWRLSCVGGAGTPFVSAAEAARRGHDMVMTPRSCCYLDYPQFSSEDPYVYHAPWRPPLTLEMAYSFDPVSGIPNDVRSRIIGGQANVWGEAIRTVFDLEWKMWPRACAIAEALWTAPARRDFADFRHRMLRHRARLVEQHVNAAPVLP